MPHTIALVTDTHVRVPYDDGQRAFPSDAGHNDRNRIVAEMIRGMKPDLIVHLGDVVHPIPTLSTHVEALRVADEIYGDLGCPIVVVPGNHDVGDKRTTANAPAQVQQGRDAFRERWGAPFQSLDLPGAHLVIVDGTLLEAETEEGDAQRAWLAQDLADASKRTFVFTHYPPFLCTADEPEHYDNLGPSTRAWLLQLCTTHGVEALFSGHVHRFFYNRHGDMDLYSLPSAAFTRPEYAALRRVPPADAEHGRDDRPHLGVSLLTITDTGHELQVMRPFVAQPRPGPRRRLGVWLRHRLGRTAELPYGDLDALTRKVARDDAALLHVLDLGLSRIRIPLTDLQDEAVRHRLALLARHGVATGVFSAASASGLPTDDERALYDAHGGDAEWEVVARPRDLERIRSALASWTGPALTLGRIGKPHDGGDSGYHSHFPREGFAPDDPALDELCRASAVTRIAFRIGSPGEVAPQVAAAAQRAEALGVGATCHVEIPWGTESERQVDDEVVAARCVQAVRAAEAHPSARVLLDLLFDKDRGYWPRNALIDGADQRRAAYDAIKTAPP
ncbi:MAG: metallophosphoesterase [Myxococcales bacterium]|nr:metallophosphoesterase [Myxococcales bacterium]